MPTRIASLAELKQPNKDEIRRMGRRKSPLEQEEHLRMGLVGFIIAHMKPRKLEKYTLGTLPDGSVVLELELPTTGEHWMLTFDEPGYERLLEKLANTKAIAEQRKAAARSKLS